MDMFIGKTPGTIGETSVIALLIGAAILVGMRIISLRIPVAYLGSFAVLMFFFGQRGILNAEVMAGSADFATKLTQGGTYTLAQLMCGGIMFGAWFMATDYATTPITKKGQILFGICCGVLTFLFRTIGGSPEGVSYAIILSNLMVPLIEKITVPRAFGVVKAKKEGK
jgi:Na+-translocating ferredoxin:NAD+ oxidoreductase RnfD subunit